MISDPVVDEIKKYRAEYAKRLDYDPKKIFADIKRREEELKKEGREIVSFQPKRYKKEVA